MPLQVASGCIFLLTAILVILLAHAKSHSYRTLIITQIHSKASEPDAPRLTSALTSWTQSQCEFLVHHSKKNNNLFFPEKFVFGFVVGVYISVFLTYGNLFLFICLFFLVILSEFMFSVFSCSLTEDLITCEPTTDQQRYFNSACKRRTVEQQQHHGSRTSARPRQRCSHRRQRCFCFFFFSSFNSRFHASKLRVLVNLDRRRSFYAAAFVKSSRPLWLAVYAVFLNHMRFFLYRDSCIQICTRSSPEGSCELCAALKVQLHVSVNAWDHVALKIDAGRKVELRPCAAVHPLVCGSQRCVWGFTSQMQPGFVRGISLLLKGLGATPGLRDPVVAEVHQTARSSGKYKMIFSH